ncbi:hypothetical protein LY15_000845 [Prauserella flava]|uniref:Uncharacterized protein n=1 Tax=Prauserella sediminis TaxID=577680 RepID=A0A839XV24_9PSEU|nr:hypothetical protein [Prauserella sediminis]MCR3718884.1 hypothetical protein [Prauserella flava]MCR3733454.1 hypothetical protein [Prauserella salsuginis]
MCPPSGSTAGPHAGRCAGARLPNAWVTTAAPHLSMRFRVPPVNAAGDGSDVAVFPAQDGIGRHSTAGPRPGCESRVKHRGATGAFGGVAITRAVRVGT